MKNIIIGVSIVLLVNSIVGFVGISGKTISEVGYIWPIVYVFNIAFWGTVLIKTSKEI